MRRCVLNLLTAISLLLCVATCALWVRSHRAGDSVHYTRLWPPRLVSEITQVAGQTGDGYASIIVEHTVMGAAGDEAHLAGQGFLPGLSHWTNDAYAPRTPHASYPLGFRIDHTDMSDEHAVSLTWEVAFPLWALALLTGALPAARLYRRTRFRRRPGQCAECGYDLTGNVSGVCPECGTAG